MATVGYGMYNRIFHCTGTVGFGVGIGVHMSHNKLFHHGYCWVWYVYMYMYTCTYNNLFHHISTVGLGIGMGIGEHMSHNKLCHHPLPDLTACLPKSQLMVWMRIKKIVVIEYFSGLFVFLLRKFKVLSQLNMAVIICLLISSLIIL